MDNWNRLIKLRDAHPKDSEVYNKSDILLGQLNTAGGKHIIGREVELFLQEHEKK